MRVYFFGCWNDAGHFLHAPGGHRDYLHALERLPTGVHIDGALAPRLMRRDRRYGAHLRHGTLCWAGQGTTSEEAQGIQYDSEELPQGHYLIHHLDNGFTAIAWWDRCQGDTRGGCNSALLLEGKHDAATMLAALDEHFPHVVDNLNRHGVELAEVPR